MSGVRKIFRSVSAILLAVWYLCAIVGFDIHTDHLHGRVYVVPMFAGLSCEAIHPEEACHCHVSGECDEDEDCSNEMEYISIVDTCPLLSVDFTPVFSWSRVVGTDEALCGSSRRSSDGFGPATSREILSDICILRV